MVVELLSPGTEREDLGATEPDPAQPPAKWQVYEQILRVPYYVVFSRYTDELHCFELTGGRYREVQPAEERLWLPEAEVGLGLWWGTYQGVERRWLRFYDAQGAWIPTLPEAERQRADQERQRAEQERQRAEQERQRAERLVAQLRALGVEPDQP